MQSITHAMLAAIITLVLGTPLLASAQTTYAYPYQVGYTPSLTCAPGAQTVQAGSPVSFTAQGGYGTFSWVTPEHTYPNIGPSLNTTLYRPGQQLVVVTSGPQSATCTVNVTGGVGVPAGMINNPVQLTTSYVPALPNTGFEPLNMAMVVSAIILLLVATLFALPYAKKAFAAAIR